MHFFIHILVFMLNPRDVETTVCAMVMSGSGCDAGAAGCTRLERDMFVLLWGPTVAAVSVVLDHAEAADIVGTAVDGLLHAARIAAFHHVDEVTSPLCPLAPAHFPPCASCGLSHVVLHATRVAALRLVKEVMARLTVPSSHVAIPECPALITLLRWSHQ